MKRDKKLLHIKDFLYNTALPIATYAYFGLWLFFIKPIIHACTLFDLGQLTGSYIAWTIFECVILSPAVGLLAVVAVVFIECFIDSLIETIIKTRRKDS